MIKNYIHLSQKNINKINEIKSSDQVELIKYINWEKFIEVYSPLKDILFDKDTKDINLTREMIFGFVKKYNETNDLNLFKKIIVYILAWWYTDWRIGSIKASKYIFSHFDKYTKNIYDLLTEKNRDTKNIEDFRSKNLKYIWISTLTKIFFFFDYKIEGFTPLILDDKIRKNLEEYFGIELDRDIDEDYIIYLQLMNNTLKFYKEKGDILSSVDLWLLELYIFNLKNYGWDN